MAPVSLRRLALAGVVALLVGAAPLAQTTEPAQDDYIEALPTRANAGDAEAQVNLGQTYDFGAGVPEDDVEAMAWYRQAAEQGHAGARFNLGVMYRNGEGVPQDDVEAYRWLNLATTYTDASRREEFAEARDTTAERLTPEQRAEGQRRRVSGSKRTRGARSLQDAYRAAVHARNSGAVRAGTVAPKLVRLRIRFFKWIHWTWAVRVLEEHFER